MKIKDIIELFNQIAPFQYQESYDNSGLQIGNVEDVIRSALLCLDITEDVLQEAIDNSCNLIIAHHPLIFSGIKHITQSTYIERIITKAIQHQINIIAIHTNLDNQHDGVNKKIAEKLKLQKTSILSPINNTLYKLQTYVPIEQAQKVREKLFAAGAGKIGHYGECSFNSIGEGTFKGDISTHPFIGIANGPQENVKEIKIETIVPSHLKTNVLKSLIDAHPYEEPAYDWILLNNKNSQIGAGMIGYLQEEMPLVDFLKMLKKELCADVVKYTKPTKKRIKKVAICGGSGSFLLQNAIDAQADVFVSADFKYHQFFNTESKIIICDIGHYETEQFTVDIFDEILNKKNITFAVLKSNINTNPIKYYF